MGYIALATDSFAEMTHFYGEVVGFRLLAEWDRDNARGQQYDLGRLRLEILDNRREKKPLSLGDPDERIHLVIEVEDVDAAHRRLPIGTPAPEATSWGAKMFRIRDPDGIPLTFLEWTSTDGARL